MLTHNLLGKVKNKMQIHLLLTHLFVLLEGVAFTLALDRDMFWLGEESDSLSR